MEYFQMIMALVGVLALVFVIFWLMKKFNARVSLNDTRHLKVLERVNLGPDKMLLIVSVCGKCMLLGVTTQSTEKICDLDETEEELLAKQSNKQSFPTFSESFKNILGKKKAEEAALNETKVDVEAERGETKVGDKAEFNETKNGGETAFNETKVDEEKDDNIIQ